MDYINNYHKETVERKMRWLEGQAKKPFDSQRAAERSRKMYNELMARSQEVKNEKPCIG